MKRVYRIGSWIVAGVGVVAACITGCPRIKNALTPDFKETRIYPDENRIAPPDTVINVNGVPVKMIGVKGGKIDCRGQKKILELQDFYISETEVTQELWAAVMGEIPSVRHAGDSLPVETVDLVACVEFVHKLDSVTGHKFSIPTYPEWLYAAYLGIGQDESFPIDSMAWHKYNSNSVSHAVKQKRPDNLGLYDMFGTVEEWTLSGADPLFMVVGGSFEDEMDGFDADSPDYAHESVATGTIGLRLVSFPENSGGDK